MTRSPRLPRARTRPTPGQLGMFDAALLTVLLPHGRSLSLLQGGRATTPAPTPAAPVVAQRRAA